MLQWKTNFLKLLAERVLGLANFAGVRFIEDLVALEVN